MDSIQALTLKAPRDGLLLGGTHPWERRKLQVGDSAQPGWTILELPNLSHLEIEAGLSDVDDGLLQVGMPVRCTLDVLPDASMDGRIEAISPMASETERSSLRRIFAVRVSLAGPLSDRIRPGMSAKVEVPLPGQKDALLAPRSALKLTASGAEAVRKDGTRVAVALAGCDAQRCAVERGLAEGDRLRVEGTP
jgi:HlyD family secretion protein